MRKSTSVKLSITAAVALALTGCGSGVPDDSYQAVCTDPKTNQRVSDNRCDTNGNGSNAFLWYYLAMGRNYPAVGQSVSGGGYDAPRSGNYVRGGAPATGGKVTADTITKASTAKGASTYVGGSKGVPGGISKGGFGGGAKGGGSGG